MADSGYLQLPVHKTLEGLRNDRQALATAIDNVPVTHDRKFVHIQYNQPLQRRCSNSDSPTLFSSCLICMETAGRLFPKAMKWTVQACWITLTGHPGPHPKMTKMQAAAIRGFLHKASSNGLLAVALYRASAPCVIGFSMGLLIRGLAAKQPRTGELIDDRPGMLPGRVVLTLAACRVPRFSPLGKNEVR